MNIRSGGMRVIGAALLLAGVLCAGRAAADVDLTGQWRIETDNIFGPEREIHDATFTQSGATLTLEFADSPGTLYPGTIDPVAGSFTVPLGTVIAICPAPPPIGPVPVESPPRHLDGTADAGGIRFTGTR